MSTRKLITALTAVLVGIPGCKSAAARQELQVILDESKRQPAPEWQLADVDGKSVNLSDFKGKVIILNFWATWCPPCREEIPGFIALQKQYLDKGLVVVGVSLDIDGPASVKAFMGKMKINYPIVMGDQKIAAEYVGVSPFPLPITFVIDRQGHIAARQEGYASQAAFEAALKPLL